jgi:hypothetical protein
MEEGTKMQINALVSSGASFSLRGYSFSEEENGYVEDVIYSTKDITAGGINTLFS